MNYSRVSGPADAPCIECINPVRGRWCIRWDYQPDADNSALASYIECTLQHKPSASEVTDIITAWVNQQVDQRILQGLTFEGSVVWLSIENQLNYKSAYDLAVQTEGESLPVVIKMGPEEAPVYRQFSDLTDFSSFYHDVVNHIERSIAWGWEQKDAIDTTLYT
ncbi:MAG: hypothetical protein K6E86_02145 [Bacteroidales bacterium]|nr:hypothetical protein [Bacteroidales bacterium]